MEYRTYPVKIKYQEKYLPPRCRKPRYREAEKLYYAKIRIVDKNDAPVAFILSDYSHRDKGQVKIRLYNGKFYHLETWQHYGPGKPETPWHEEFIGWRPETVERFKLRYWNTNADYDTQRKGYHDEAASRIIINGLIWIRCGEPMYETLTFGLGHNHGGTGLFVETEYNPNVSKNNYFNALQGDQAVEYTNSIAKGRGDTKDIGRFKKMIEVLIPECVRRNPQKEHGEGDPFINNLNAITQNANSAAEAGILAIMSTMAEINK